MTQDVERPADVGEAVADESGAIAAAGENPQNAQEKNRAAIAEELFMKAFNPLCRTPEDFEELKKAKWGIMTRWGSYGLDMVSAFARQYKNVDFGRLKAAIQVFVNSKAEDIQQAVEELWWLMGMGDYQELLADDARWEAFRRLMMERGFEECQIRAAQIRRRIDAVTGPRD